MSEDFYAKCDQCGTVNRFLNKAGQQPKCGKCAARLNLQNATSDRPVEVSDSTFSVEVLGSGVPVLVDFYATWCGACRSLEPTLEAVASRYKGKLRVFKLDVDRNPTHAKQFQIRATPTLMVFQNGEVVQQVTGALPEQQLEALVTEYLS